MDAVPTSPEADEDSDSDAGDASQNQKASLPVTKVVPEDLAKFSIHRSGNSKKTRFWKGKRANANKRSSLDSDKRMEATVTKVRGAELGMSFAQLTLEVLNEAKLASKLSQNEGDECLSYSNTEEGRGSEGDNEEEGGDDHMTVAFSVNFEAVEVDNNEIDNSVSVSAHQVDNSASVAARQLAKSWHGEKRLVPSKTIQTLHQSGLSIESFYAQDIVSTSKPTLLSKEDSKARSTTDGLPPATARRAKSSDEVTALADITKNPSFEAKREKTKSKVGKDYMKQRLGGLTSEQCLAEVTAATAKLRNLAKRKEPK
jgi:hypothetical protein